MDFAGCVDCGFKCERACPVSRGVKKYYLRAFLKDYLTRHEPISWPCMNCHACDAVCSAESSPRQLIHEAMQHFLADHENALSDYREELAERGRIGVSSVFLDNLVLPEISAGKHSFLKEFDRIVVFPGCVVSARFPGLVYRMFQLLVLLGVDPKRIVVEDDLCCGSFLDQVDSTLFSTNGVQVFKRMIEKASHVLVLTSCGSCTATLRELKDRIVARAKAGNARATMSGMNIMHYAELLSLAESRAMLQPLLNPEKIAGTKTNGVHVYMQYPCQATIDDETRDERVNGLGDLLGMLGYVVTSIDKDLACCGSSLLDTHPDLAIEYGIRRVTNITDRSKVPIDQIVIACGNCYRLLVDFKPSMDVENDGAEGGPFRVLFLLDLVMEKIELSS
jgi:Fe-S oxidoreductase